MFNFGRVRGAVEVAISGFQKRMKVYDEAGVECEPISHAFIWRHKVSLVRLLTDVTLYFNTPPGSAGPTVQKWRDQGDKNRVVTRFIINALQQQGSLTRAELIDIVGKNAAKSTVNNVIADGIRLGLLEKQGRGYNFTDLCFIELFSRGLAKILNPLVVEFCRLVVRFHDQRAENLKLQKLEAQGLYTESSFVTINERIFEEAKLQSKIDE